MAICIFKRIMDIQIHVEDEDGGDSFELDIEGMAAEKLTGINLKVLALNVLYLEYQLQPAGNLAKRLFAYFESPYFKEIHIEDIFSIGREELKDQDLFWQAWIDFLMQQRGENAARLQKF